MAKIITKAVTRLQKFLAAIAGDAVAPTPITNQEKLLFNIAEEMKAASASGMPAVTADNAGQVATVNDSGVWVAANPSSGGLPEVTEADVGKVLTVIITGATKGAVIVPTQRKSLESHSTAELDGVNESLFVNGTKVMFVVNDDEYVETITGGSVTHGDYEISISKEGMALQNNSAYDVSVTVALYVANDVTYGWGAANA